MDRGIDADLAAQAGSSRWIRRTTRALLGLAALCGAVVLLLAGAQAAVDAGVAVAVWDVVDLGR